GTFVAPYQYLVPVKFLTAERAHFVVTLACNEWLCRYLPSVASGVITSLANRAAWYAFLTMPRRGQSMVALEQPRASTSLARQTVECFAPKHVLNCEKTVSLSPKRLSTMPMVVWCRRLTASGL